MTRRGMSMYHSYYFLCMKYPVLLRVILLYDMMKYDTSWHEYVPFILFSLHEVPCATTGVSPAMLLYGKQIKGPCHLLREIWSSSDKLIEGVLPQTALQYLTDLHQRLEVAAKTAELNSEVNQPKYVKYHNKHAK